MGCVDYLPELQVVPPIYFEQAYSGYYRDCTEISHFLRQPGPGPLNKWSATALKISAGSVSEIHYNKPIAMHELNERWFPEQTQDLI